MKTDGKMRKGPLTRLQAVAFYASTLILCCFAYPLQVSAQEYDLGNDEFSVTLPGKPEQDKQFSATYPSYHAYRVTVNDIYYFVLLKTKDVSARKGYEYQLLSLKGHSIGYNAGFTQESNRKGISVSMVLDRDLKLNGFPGRQYRIVSSTDPGVVRFYSTDRFVYTLQVLGATERDQPVKDFFNSVKLRRGR